jgi:hypothetical protein
MGAAEVTAFLFHLAVERDVSASTQFSSRFQELPVALGVTEA